MDVVHAQQATPRRSGDETKAAIREAAARLFAERGFIATAVRDIAKEARTDAALVIRYFGSKERLFVEAMTIEDVLDGAAEGPLDELGSRLLRRLLAVPAEGQGIYVALMRAAERTEVREYLVRMTETQLVDPIAARLPGPDARIRATLIAAQIQGLLNALWMLGQPALDGVAVDPIVHAYGSAIQALIDDRTPLAPSD